MTVNKDWHTATLSNKATIKDAINNLSASSLQIILVIEENNLLLGTITDGDIRRAILRGSTLDSGLKDLMNNDPLVVSSNMSTDSVLHLMNSKGLHAIPIVDKKRHVLGLHLIKEMIAPEEKNNQMIIMAGGKGSRLLPATKDCPKPLLPVNGKPMFCAGCSLFVIYY